MTQAAPLFSVVVPSLGDEAKLSHLLGALEVQTLPRERFETVIALDGVAPSAGLLRAAESAGARIVPLPRRLGPGRTRNRGAAESLGDYLAFTEDDVTPAADWLARAASRLEAEPVLDVLVGLTVKPGGRAVHHARGDGPDFLPTNLFVRRVLFTRLGGYSGLYFDAARGLYFREDSDFGFILERSGARIAVEPTAVVTHPEEHAGWLDPLRWAARHEMDPLLAARHPERFRRDIEIHHVGPLRVRRPIARASMLCATATAMAAVALAMHAPQTALALAVLAVLALLVVWAKWSFSLARLPVIALVPFVLTIALLRGHFHVALLRRKGLV